MLSAAVGAAMLAVVLPVRGNAQAGAYPWIATYDDTQSIGARIPPPAGYRRTDLADNAFGRWLRRLPLKPGRPDVHLYDGRLKRNQDAHAAVVDMDVGERDLQQCADAVIRLRAEFLYAAGQEAAITFTFTSGDPAPFSRWAAGFRPTVHGTSVTWSPTAAPDRGYASFRAYLTHVFVYAGSASLSRELDPVVPLAAIQPGDVFIQGGFPGHAVLVVDTAVHEETGRPIFLLVQSFMPAQEVHVLRNPTDATLSPWYATDVRDRLRTPEWEFKITDLKRFP